MGAGCDLCGLCFNHILPYWRTYVVLFTPIVLLKILFIGTPVCLIKSSLLTLTFLTILKSFLGSCDWICCSYHGHLLDDRGSILFSDNAHLTCDKSSLMFHFKGASFASDVTITNSCIPASRHIRHRPGLQELFLRNSGYVHRRTNGRTSCRIF